MNTSRRVTSGRPTNGLVRPTQLVADTGMDMRSSYVASACLTSGSAIRFAPPRIPATKSSVELVLSELAAHSHLT
jgi:hypothetical protein